MWNDTEPAGLGWADAVQIFCLEAFLPAFPGPALQLGDKALFPSYFNERLLWAGLVQRDEGSPVISATSWVPQLSVGELPAWPVELGNAFQKHLSHLKLIIPG